MKESAVWPYNIVPALRKRALEAVEATGGDPLLDVHQRVVDGLRELRELEPGSVAPGGLLALCETWACFTGGALLPAQQVLLHVGVTEGE